MAPGAARMAHEAAVAAPELAPQGCVKAQPAEAGVLGEQVESHTVLRPCVLPGVVLQAEGPEKAGHWQKCDTF